MDGPNNHAGGKKKKKKAQREERQRKHQGGNGAEALAVSEKCGGNVLSGQNASDLGKTPNSEPGDIVLPMLSDTSENLESCSTVETEVVRGEQSGAAENISLVVDGLSRDESCPSRPDGSIGSASWEEEEGSKRREVLVEQGLEADVALPGSPSSFINDTDSPLQGESISVDTVEGLAPEHSATGNSPSDLGKYEESMPSRDANLQEQVHTLESTNVELAILEFDNANESEQVNSKLSEGTQESQEAHFEDEVAVGDELTSEIQINQEVGSPVLDLKKDEDGELQGAGQCSEDRPAGFLKIFNSQPSHGDALHHFKGEKNRNMSMDESFVDALDHLTESRSASLEESSFLMKGDFLEKEGQLSELYACRNALMQANEEKAELVSKLNSYQMQIEKIEQEKYSLEVNPTDLPNTKSCCRTELGVSIPELHEMPMHNPVLKIGQSVFSEEAEKTASLLLEQERLKQMVHDLEQEKSEMANTLEDLRAQLQSKTLETTQQNLHESIEQKDALAVDSDIDLEKASGLLEEKLRISQTEGEDLTKCGNQCPLDFNTLQQKLDDLEAEKEAAFSKMKEVERNVGVESVGETQEGKACLEVEVERFIKRAKDREEEYVQMLEKLRTQVQSLNDENRNLLTQLDEHAKNMAMTEQENQLVRNELAEMRPILDEANKAKERITRDYECYQLETCSAMVEKERLETEAMRARQLTDELHSRICQHSDEMHEIKNEKVKATNNLDEFKVLVKKLENERAELSEDLHVVRTELEQIKKEADFHKKLEEERNQFSEENAKLSAELYDFKEYLLRRQVEKSEHDKRLRDMVLELHKATSENMNFASNVQKNRHMLTEVEGECFLPIPEARYDSPMLQSQTELLHGEYTDQETSLGVHKTDDKNSTVHRAENVEETIQPSKSINESEISNIDLQLATAVSIAVKMLAECTILQDERDSAIRQLDITHDQLRKLVQQQERMTEHSEELVDRLRHAESNEVGGEDRQSFVALDILVADCSKFIKKLQKALDERSQFEPTIRELESVLFSKDQDIQDMNGKFVELSQKCAQLEEISGKCTVLDEKCSEMAFQAAQNANERDSLSLEVDALRKSLSEKEISMKASSEFHSDLKHQFDTTIEKLIASIEEVIQDETFVAVPCMERMSYLETSLLLLIEKYKVAFSQVNLVHKCLLELASDYGNSWEKEPTLAFDVVLREVFSYKEKELDQLNEKIDVMNSIKTQHEEEIRELKDRLCKFDENLKEMSMDNSKIRTDLEQTENKLSSVREKLSLAIAKGKGLVQERNTLRQSLVDKSNELEKCLQELQKKNDTSHETEMNASEHVKALELELEDIKNSASAFRESVSNKDSILQKIENVFGEMNLPEVIHSKEIIDKVEWLAKSSLGANNTTPSSRGDLKMTEWNDANVTISKSSEISVDDDKTEKSHLEDLKEEYEELQNKYHSVVEQSDILEKSLLERNHLIQRWEQILEKVDMPTSMQSTDPELRIEWLSRALTQAQQDAVRFKHEIENVQRIADLSAFELEESKRRIESLEENLLKVNHEKQEYVKSLEELNSKFESLTEQTVQDASRKESLCDELVDQHMSEPPVESSIADKSLITEDCMRRLLDMVIETLKDQDLQELSSCCSSGEYLEGCLRKVIAKLNELSEEVEKLKESGSAKMMELQGLRAAMTANNTELKEMTKKQEEVYLAVASHRAEIESHMQQNRIMAEELETVKKQKDALQVQLEEAEERSSVIREKLTMAVRKGKGLAQQRDNLKQSMDEKVVELEQLKAELQLRDSAINEHEQRISRLSSELERFESLETDVFSLKNHCSELEKKLLDSNSTMQSIMKMLNAIDFTGEVLHQDPVKKIDWLGKSVNELQQKVGFAEQEAMKFKGEANILATKLDKVFERVHSLESELADAENKVSALMNEKKAVETESDHEIQKIKDDLAARTEELREAHSRADDQISKLLKQHAQLKHLKKEYGCLLSLLAHDSSRKQEVLKSVKLSFQDILSQLEASKGLELPSTDLMSGWTNPKVKLSKEGKYLANEAIVQTYPEEHLDHLVENGNLQRGQMVDKLLNHLEHVLDECTGELELLKEGFEEHSYAFNQEAIVLSQLSESTRRGVLTVVEYLESLKLNVSNLEAHNKHRDNEIFMFRDNITVLLNVCNNAMEQLQNWKVHVSSENSSSSEEVTTTFNRAFSAPENTFALQSTGQVDFTVTAKCMKTAEDLLLTIRDAVNAANEKFQKGESREAENLRVCGELESKLMKAEAVTIDIARESDVDKGKISELESHIESLELSVDQLKTREASLNAMQEEITSLHDALSTKNQALENLYRKLEEMENDTYQKQTALESLESSHQKAVAEVADTVRRYEELRQLSEGLIAEVESLNLQLESREDEISCLREEAKKSMSDVPVLLENTDKKNREILDLQMGLESIITKLGGNDMLLEVNEGDRTHAILGTLEKRIAFLMSESNSFRVDAQSKDVLLQNTQNLVEELSSKLELLETSLHDKQTRFENFQTEEHLKSGEIAAEVSEIEELGQSSNNSLSSVPVAPHVRSTRKASSDHLALNIDMDSDKSTSDCEDDEKGHVFKSLTSTGIIPKSTRSLADRIDGIWVSGGRMLMRQPTARMGLIVYWVVLHFWMVVTLL